jgi:DNA-binding transcriptional regulator YiaG
VRYECDHCKHKYTGVKEEVQLLQTIAIHLLEKPAPLTGAEMRYLRTECDHTQIQFARLLGVTRETVVMRESWRRTTRESDYLFRAVAVETFWRLLQDKDRCFLTSRQVAELDALRRRFAAKSLEKPRMRRRRLSLTHDREWTAKAA